MKNIPIYLAIILAPLAAACGNGSSANNFASDTTALANNYKYLIKPYSNGESYYATKIDSTRENYISFTSTNGAKIVVNGSFVIEEIK